MTNRQLRDKWFGGLAGRLETTGYVKTLGRVSHWRSEDLWLEGLTGGLDEGLSHSDSVIHQRRVRGTNVTWEPNGTLRTLGLLRDAEEYRGRWRMLVSLRNMREVGLLLLILARTYGW